MEFQLFFCIKAQTAIAVWKAFAPRALHAAMCFIYSLTFYPHTAWLLGGLLANRINHPPSQLLSLCLSSCCWTPPAMSPHPQWTSIRTCRCDLFATESTSRRPIGLPPCILTPPRPAEYLALEQKTNTLYHRNNMSLHQACAGVTGGTSASRLFAQSIKKRAPPLKALSSLFVLLTLQCWQPPNLQPLHSTTCTIEHLHLKQSLHSHV